jgi:hypothetical protein
LDEAFILDGMLLVGSHRSEGCEGTFYMTPPGPDAAVDVGCGLEFNEAVWLHPESRIGTVGIPSRLTLSRAGIGLLEPGFFAVGKRYIPTIAGDVDKNGLGKGFMEERNQKAIARGLLCKTQVGISVQAHEPAINASVEGLRPAKAPALLIHPSCGKLRRYRFKMVRDLW